MAAVETGNFEFMYYLCSENKGADQLRSYCETDLRLFFSRLQNVSLMMRLKLIFVITHIFALFKKVSSPDPFVLERGQLDIQQSVHPYIRSLFSYVSLIYTTNHNQMPRGAVVE